jgi:hypothetical protein
MKKFLATTVAVLALTAPALAADTGRLDAYALEPLGDVPTHGIDFGIGYAVANAGPVRISPLVGVAGVNGVGHIQLGVAETVGLFKHFDVGLAEEQRPGSVGFRSIGTSAIVGIRL